MGSGVINIDKATPGTPGVDVTLESTLGGIHTYNLSTGVSRVASGTYNSTEVYGFWILASGTGDTLTCNLKDGTQIVLTTAEMDVLIALDSFVPWHCTSIVLSDPAIEILVNRPPA